ncbi:MAG: type IX secretion system membrane protein PorP/SprF [Saprospiraceae bacterium]|nr:type IX secretion system membrane protein PorP/SprF [Saprospiraceae bacterium]
MKKIIFAFTLVCFGFLMTAQDIHFSQFYMSPLNLNPALTGVMNCNKRFIGNFRNQWASVLRSNAYNTYSATYDQKIPVGRYDYFGIGEDFGGMSQVSSTLVPYKANCQVLLANAWPVVEPILITWLPDLTLELLQGV